MAAQLNSFFRFVFGFSLFVAVSLGLTFLVGTYSLKRERQEQTASAFKSMLNEPAQPAWWEVWK